MIPLLNKETGQKLLFKFENTQIGSVGISAAEEKKDNKKPQTTKKVEPKQNFGTK